MGSSTTCGAGARVAVGVARGGAYGRARCEGVGAGAGGGYRPVTPVWQQEEEGVAGAGPGPARQSDKCLSAHCTHHSF